MTSPAIDAILLQIVSDAKATLTATTSVPDLEQVKARFLGKSGSLTEQLKGLGKLPARTPPALPPLKLPPAPAQTAVLLIDRPGAVQSALFAGHPFPERSAPGYEARQVVNNLLGGLFTSRLNLNLREKHAYTYGVRSRVLATRRFGAFAVQSSIETQNTADAVEQLLLELRALAGGKPEQITLEELERSKTDLVHQLGGHLEHVRTVLADTTELYVDGLPADYHRQFLSAIRAVDQRAAAAEAARLTPERMTLVIVGDQEKLLPMLRPNQYQSQLFQDCVCWQGLPVYRYFYNLPI